MLFMTEKKPSPLIQSLQRAIEILNCFTEKEPILSLPQVSQKTGLNINTTRGLVNTLVYYHLLIHDTEANVYSLGQYFTEKFALIRQTWSLDSVEKNSLVFMKELTEKYAVFSSLQIVRENQIFMIKAIQPKQTHYHITHALYAPMESYCTASGKLLLQYLPAPLQKKTLECIQFHPYTENTILSVKDLLIALRKQEETIYATEYDELDSGISSIAAPVLLSPQNLFGTLSVTAPSQVLKKQQKEICSDLLNAANKLSQMIRVLEEDDK